ncbi:MAG: hypothetical protein ACK4V6_02815 [Microthrixaceae bacterium]
MVKKRVNDELLFHDKVVAAVDLPGVPMGTPGKVTLKNGFRWIRYRVYFENGADIGSLDRAQLALRKEWDERTETVGGTTS